jgi:hypothetical protein
MAVDGTVFDLPDIDVTARVFGYSSIRARTEAFFPKVRLLWLVEDGTHLITDAFLSPYRIGERRNALLLRRSLEPGMLLMWDRGFHSFKVVNVTQKRGSHILWEESQKM